MAEQSGRLTPTASSSSRPPAMVPFPSPSPPPISPSSRLSSRSLTSDPPASPSPPSTSSRRHAGRPSYTAGQKPQAFSRSAAKRDSVLALSSIAHLQHRFAKQGLASKEKPSSSSNLVLAIPHSPPRSSLLIEEEEEEEDDEDADEDDHRALSPVPPPPPSRTEPVFPRGRTASSLTDLEAARRDVMLHLDAVRNRWALQSAAVSSPSQRREDPGGSVLDTDAGVDADVEFVPGLLTTTTQAVRSVQKLMTTLPPLPPSSDPSFPPAPGMGTRSLGKKASHLGLSTAARPVAVRSQPSSTLDLLPLRTSSAAYLGVPSPAIASEEGPRTQAEVLTVLRRASLDVLGSLKDLEHRFRLPGSSSPVPPPTSSSSRSGSPPLSSSSDYESTDLASSVAWEYRADVGVGDVKVEAEVVGRWLQAVEGLLQILDRAGEQSWRRRASAGHRPPPREETRNQAGAGTAQTDTTDVPGWAALEPATGGDEEDRLLQRARSCILAHVPDGLPQATSREAFLDTLQDGETLCLAFNAATRAARRPWGFIPDESIHRIRDRDRDRHAAGTGSAASVAMERRQSGSGDGTGGTRVGMTFRRMENLRAFAAACKLRYAVKTDFDPSLVAGRGPSWESTLQALVFAWVDVVVSEIREELQRDERVLD